MPVPPALLAKIRLLVLDVDGTLTDGRLYYGLTGEQLKAFDVRDGHGLRLLSMYTGMKLAVLTGRRADLVQARCAELSIDDVVGGSRDKARSLRELAGRLEVPLEAVAFMGDDVNDLPALAIAGLAACPRDAAPEVLRACAFVSSRDGGRGAVRELCEAFLAATVGWPPPEDAKVVQPLPPRDPKKP
jgi:3-deoxy-D-manno-octulosonate 8-phosphate phosphatase (KDO 8-P phosphatase)